ncbi:hypothetical protein CASFOL_038341 [Castilleja foliolosa]|uniref:DUF4228 domain protein n=1 Tax=Castilleja foliolosa TaxID=1961234 RepID=A0ABD3BKR6_9LAMI
MGNCQAIDNASIVIQHPDGKTDKLYCPVSAAEITKMNPGHYVALLLTTTLYSSAAAAAADGGRTKPNSKNNTPLRVTRIKLLRPTDTLVLGHVYRLVTTKEVMKGLWAKKQAKMQQQNKSEKQSSDSQVNQEKHRSRNKTSASKSRAWQPALKSINEAAT